MPKQFELVNLNIVRNLPCKSQIKNQFHYWLKTYGNAQTSLLRRLQTQTLPNATQPIGKIHPFSKIAVIFEPAVQFGCPSRFRIS